MRDSLARVGVVIRVPGRCDIDENSYRGGRQILVSEVVGFAFGFVMLVRLVAVVRATEVVGAVVASPRAGPEGC